jgi:hypothetical protein
MAVGEAFVEIGVDFAQLRRSLGKAKGEFAVKVKQIEGNAAKAGGRIGKSLGQGLAKGLKAATVGLGALFVAGGLAVKSFMTSQKESLRLAKTLKATGNAAGFTAEQLEAHARKLQDATTIDDTDIKTVMATISTFTNLTGKQFKQATKASLDLASAFKSLNTEQAALQLSKALADPAKGLTMLRRSGVLFTDQQKSMIETMFKMGKVAEAQTEIFALLRENGIDGNADATAALADQWEQSTNVLEDIIVDLGKAIAGMFGLTDGSTKLSDAFKTMRDSIKEVIDTGFFKDLGAVMLPILKHVAKLTVLIAGGLAMMAAAATALLSGKGFAAMDQQILAISKSMKKVLLSIDRMGKKTKETGKNGAAMAKKQTDANKKLKDAIQARIEHLKNELESNKRLLRLEEGRLKNMQKVKKQLQKISSIQTIGLEDRFTQRSTEAAKGRKEALQKVVDADIAAQKETIKSTKSSIKSIEGKLRAEGIQKAAAQQVKNQEIQIQLQKETNTILKQQSGGSVFAND